MRFATSAFVFEVILDNNRAKNCRKASFRKNLKNHIHPTCIKQNNLRRTLKEILPAQTKEIEDSRFGVDYEFMGVKIDQKFSFGALGNNNIKIRVQNRRLLNHSDWTMVINKNCEIELFQTAKLADFVRKNWGIVQKKLIAKKKMHSEYSINLWELYKLEQVIPIKTELTSESLIESLKEISKTPNLLDEELINFIPQPQNIENQNMPKNSIANRVQQLPRLKNPQAYNWI